MRILSTKSRDHTSSFRTLQHSENILAGIRSMDNQQL